MGRAVRHTGTKERAARPVKPRSALNARDYIIPTGWKRKRNISGAIDGILYGATKR